MSSTLRCLRKSGYIVFPVSFTGQLHSCYIHEKSLPYWRSKSLQSSSRKKLKARIILFLLLYQIVKTAFIKDINTISHPVQEFAIENILSQCNKDDRSQGTKDFDRF